MKPVRIALLGFLLSTVACAQPRSIKPDSPAITKWKALLPRIEAMLAQNELYHCPTGWKPGILDAADFPAGVSVAFLDWCNGGAYTNWIALMNLEDGQPVFSRIRPAKKDTGFLQGASVKHGADAKLVPEKNAVYSIHSESDDRLRQTHCSVDAFIWDIKTHTFEWSKQLTKEATRSYCHGPQKRRLKDARDLLPPAKR